MFARLAARCRLVLLLALAAACGFAGASLAREGERGAGIGWVTLAELPPEARETLRLIRNGGPFPYPGKDGSIFGNFERQLPYQARGYYREYTVPSPGRHDRGAQRLVAGASADEYYYSDDHYRTFRRVRTP